MEIERLSTFRVILHCNSGKGRIFEQKDSRFIGGDD